MWWVWIALYGLNELVYRLTRLLVNNHTNLNDSTISAQIHDAPRVTLLIVIFLAPFVEEVLFRGPGIRKSEAQEPHCRLCRKLSAVRPAPCLAGRSTTSPAAMRSATWDDKLLNMRHSVLLTWDAQTLRALAAAWSKTELHSVPVWS